MSKIDMSKLWIGLQFVEMVALNQLVIFTLDKNPYLF